MMLYSVECRGRDITIEMKGHLTWYMYITMNTVGLKYILIETKYHRMWYIAMDTNNNLMWYIISDTSGHLM